MSSASMRGLRRMRVATTKKFYARGRSEAAWISLERAWGRSTVQKAIGLIRKRTGVKRACGDSSHSVCSAFGQ